LWGFVSLLWFVGPFCLVWFLEVVGGLCFVFLAGLFDVLGVAGVGAEFLFVVELGVADGAVF